MAKRHWRELSSSQKMLVVGGAFVQFTLLGAALWDLRRRPGKRVRGPKRLWQAVVFVNYIGPVAYFFLGRKD